MLVIVNPISGTKSKAGIVAAIHKYMTPDRFDAEIRYTQRKGHAAQIAAEAIGQDVDIVVAVGGDGTVNETARALIHTNVALCP